MTAIKDVAPAAPRRKDATRNRALLIEAAREVFARRGTEASLDDVAKHANLGVGTAYRHFANKHELLKALMSHTIDQVIDAAESAAATKDPWQALVAFLEAMLTVQARDRGLREVLMGVHDPEMLDRVHDSLPPLLNDMVRRARRAKVVRNDLEASDIGMMITMLCAVAEVTGEAEPDLWRRYLGLLLDGIRPGGAKLPVKALDDETMRQAMATHKKSFARPAAD